MLLKIKGHDLKIMAFFIIKRSCMNTYKQNGRNKVNYFLVHLTIQVELFRQLVVMKLPLSFIKPESEGFNIQRF